ncbi:MAG TPA: hypothetical protein VL422_17775 [Miltoncostaea sp.]|jgi:hypothetical protein|nr:hypothetical protein [Miltoncostaea sp.]
MTEDRRAFVDARGKVYPFRTVALKLADTIVRTLLVVAMLYAVSGVWELFH